MKALRTNGGGEFNLKEFWNICKSNDIRRELITSYTHQHNLCGRKAEYNGY